jgi:hypothetical protein
MKRIRKILSDIYELLKLPNRRQRVKYALNLALKDPDLYPLNTYPSFDVDRCVKGFMRNREMMHWYVKNVGAQALTYLQPLNSFGARPVSRRDLAAQAYLRRRMTGDGANELETMREFYRRVSVEFGRRRDDGFYDLTAIFDHCHRDIDLYVDPAHCSDIGYDLIARRLAEDILEREKSVSLSGFAATERFDHR